PATRGQWKGHAHHDGQRHRPASPNRGRGSEEDCQMDLTTRYMGLDLKNPLVASASPLTGELGNLRQLEDAGAAAIVLPSLFQEHIEAEARRYEALTEAGADSFPEALSYFPVQSLYHAGPERYLSLVRRAVEAVDLPIIGSLNGTTNEGWIDYAKQVEQAGAAGIELNVYFIPTDLSLTGSAVWRFSPRFALSSRSRSLSRSAHTSAHSAIWRRSSTAPVPTHWCC